MINTPPCAKKIPLLKKSPHGDTRTDPYDWIKDKTNSEVIDYLNAENEYIDQCLKPYEGLKNQLFSEIKSRIQDKDWTVPAKLGPYEYYERIETGDQYWTYCRKKIGSNQEEVILDVNALSKQFKYIKLGIVEISPNHQILAYSLDINGEEKFEIFFKDLNTGELLPDRVYNSEYAFEWAADSKTYFYNTLNDQQRPDRIYRNSLGKSADEAQCVYHETDNQFFVSLEKSKSEEYLFISSAGSVTSELQVLRADEPEGEFKVVYPRVRGVKYEIAHHKKHFLILTNENATNFKLLRAPIQQLEQKEEIISHKDHVFLEALEVFQDYFVLIEKEKGLQKLRVVDPGTFKSRWIEFDEPIYSIDMGVNLEMQSNLARVEYESLKTPSSVFEYNLETLDKKLLKQDEIPGGYDPDEYVTERIFATSHDGTQVPVSLVYKKGIQKNGKNPFYLYSYGSYGLSMDVYFSRSVLSLLERGFIFAMAHIRGGADLGRKWYEDGKFLKKKNTFLDFIAAAETVIQKKYTSSDRLVIHGGSAGGLLVGAVINLRPELFHAAIADVPFVDVINTMLDDSLPLTTIEYEEWGNPNDRTYYDYMKSYSPYDNVEAKAYPHLLVTAGLNDPRVTYWEPAKWVAKLRDLKTDQHDLYLHTNMDAGHGGSSGRYDRLKEVALMYTFILKCMGLEKPNQT